jgi:hypothetical protein
VENEQITHTGFITQEVEKVVNELGFEFSGWINHKMKTACMVHAMQSFSAIGKGRAGIEFNK